MRVVDQTVNYIFITNDIDINTIIQSLKKLDNMNVIDLIPKTKIITYYPFNRNNTVLTFY